MKQRKINGELGTDTSDRSGDGVEPSIEKVTADLDAGNSSKDNISSIHQKVVGHLIPRLKDCAVGKVNSFIIFLINI